MCRLSLLRNRFTEEEATGIQNDTAKPGTKHPTQSNVDVSHEMNLRAATLHISHLSGEASVFSRGGGEAGSVILRLCCQDAG